MMQGTMLRFSATSQSKIECSRRSPFFSSTATLHIRMSQLSMTARSSD